MLGLLNISEAMSIALHTCAVLAESPEHFGSARTISEKLGFSPHHFAKVVQQLARAGLLETERGPAGGARLTRPAAEITLFEIYVAAGGTPTYKGCLLKHNICDGHGCALGELMAKENKRLIGLLKNTNLASVVRSLKKNRIAQG
jgi:Rrf2 family protein